MKRTVSHFAMVSTIAACTMLAACEKKGDVASGDTTVGPARATSGMDTTASGGALSTKKDWNDGQIFAYAAAASDGEIQEAQIASHKAVTPAVKSFAAQMLADHKKMLADGKELAKKLSIAPDNSKGDITGLQNNVAGDLHQLNGKKAGKEWDEAYIKKQVDAHQNVLDKLQDASKSTTNPEVKKMVSQAIAKVQEHLTKAKSIKDSDVTS